MAAAIQSSASLQSTATTAALSSKTLAASPRPFSLSFSTTFNPLKLTTTIATSKLSSKPRGGGALGARMVDTAAGRYATALADVANTNGTLEATAGDIDKIDKIFCDQEAYSFFASPVIGLDKKRAVLDEIVSSVSLQPHTANFLNILLDMERFELVKDIVKDFDRVYNKLTDTELAVVTSVVKLENDHLAQIAKGVQRLTGAKNVRIKTAIDPSLVAGFTIRYGNGGSKMVDMSVRKQLEEIAAQLDLGDVQLAV